MKVLIGKKIETILGGRDYLKAAGCKFIAYNDNGLMIKIMNGKINACRIQQVGDKYDCEFFICQNSKCGLRSRFLVVESQLQDIFLLGTHLYPVINKN